MIRENQKYFNGLQVFLDILIILISFLGAYYTRFYIMQDGIVSLTFENSLPFIVATIPVYLLLYSWFDLYGPQRIKSIAQEASIILGCNIIGVLTLMALLYLFKEANFARYILLYFYIYNSILTIGCRASIRFLLRKYRKKGYNLKHCLIVGTTEMSGKLINKLHTHTFWGYHITGVIDTDHLFNITPATTPKDFSFYGHRVLGNLDNLPDLLENTYIDLVIIATDENNADKLGYIITSCEKAGIKTHIVPYYYKYVPAKPYIDDLDGLPIIDTRHIPLDNLFKNLLKRSFDIIFSLFAIIITSPIMLLAAIMVKLTSKGPIIFKQERVGLDRKNFNMYKFRSMRLQTEAEEMDKWTVKNDPRKTWWGNFMRKTSIDELPQFFNVLKGDMSVIGPRPERPFFVDKFKEEIPRYMIKHQVRPGITGWAQVNGLRGDTSIEDRIEHDLYYIENWTFGLDLKIILLTIFKGFINKNAY